jgi:hypothetical protein
MSSRCWKESGEKWDCRQRSQLEAPFGVFDHGVGSAERNTVDINGSIVTPRLNVGAPGYWAYLLPRFQLGGAADLAGRTSFGYADIVFTLPLRAAGDAGKSRSEISGPTEIWFATDERR